MRCLVHPIQVRSGSPYAGRIFPTHMPWANLAIRLYYSRFFLRESGFPNLHALAHLALRLYVMDFSSPGLDFLDSRTLSTFNHILTDFSLRKSGFPNSYTLDIFCLMSPSCRFILTWVRVFKLICIRHIWSCVFTVTNFSSCGLGFHDSCVLGTFDLLPLLWYIYPHADRVFSTHLPQAYFALRLRHNKFLLMRV